MIRARSADTVGLCPFDPEPLSRHGITSPPVPALPLKAGT